jgi:hypothetical protein
MISQFFGYSGAVLRKAQDVFDRLRALRMFLVRAHFELFLTRGRPRSEVEAENEELMRQIEAKKIAFSPIERTMISLPLGQWRDVEVAQVFWRYDSAAALLWALGALPAMPPYTVAIPPATVRDEIDALMKRDGSPTLRPESELHAALGDAETWHWRARTELLQRRGMQPPPGETFAGAIAQTTQRALELGHMTAAEVIDGDFAVDGIPYAKATAEVKMNLGCIAFERHWALTWVVDYKTEWDTVNPST